MNYSSFPDALDMFQEHMDITFLDKANLSEYQTLVMRENKTSTEIQRMNELAGILAGKLFKAYDFNKLQDAMYNVQKFFFGQLSGWNLLMENIKNQTIQQQIEFDNKQAATKIIWNEWFATVKVDLQRYSQFNFENLAALNYVEYEYTNPEISPMIETIKIAGSNILIATRTTTYNNNDINSGIGVIIENVYQDDGISILRTSQQTFNLTTRKVSVI